jgi:toxin ParE1/3/4
MEIKVLWSDTALSQLETIFNYLKFNASSEIARKLVKSLIEQTLILEANPLIGMSEPLLINKFYDYRFIIKKNYKIIYRFDNKIIRIVSVFDCRQNPNKINELSE